MTNNELPPVGTLATADRSKEAKKKEVKQVTKNAVKVDNGKLGKRFKAAIVSEDIHSVFNYLIFEKLIPDLKSSFVEMVYDGLGMYLGTSRKKKNSSGKEDYTAYSSKSYYKSSKEEPKESVHDYREIKFESKEDANEVLSSLQDFANEYGQTSLSDYYELCGVTPNSFTDNNWGWTKELIRRGAIRRYSGYWWLDLPDVVHLD